jgi:LPS-assembly lipoprotein
MLIKRRLLRALALSAAVMLSACGFHLRGSGTEAVLPFTTIYLGSADTPLLTELKRNIANGGGTLIATEAKTAQAIVDILSEAREKTVLSLNSQGRVREYTLTYRVVFRVRGSQELELLAPTEVALRRTLSFNETQVLAKEMEEATLYREMQTDMVQQILRRIAAIKPV